MLATIGVLLSVLIFGLTFGLILWFILTVRSAVLIVPKAEHKFSLWLLWLLLIPLVNYFVAWFLLPFAIPKTLAAGSSSKRAHKVTKRLFHIGLTIQLMPVFHMLIVWSSFGELVLGIINLGLCLAYWLIIYKYKQRFLSFVA